MIPGCSGALFFLGLPSWICWQVCSQPHEEGIPATGENEINVPREVETSRNICTSRSADRVRPGDADFPDPVRPIGIASYSHFFELFQYLPSYMAQYLYVCLKIKWAGFLSLAIIEPWLIQIPMQLMDRLQQVCKLPEIVCKILCVCV